MAEKNMPIVGEKIFLTGGAGFIGSAIAERLLEDNEIIIYDSLFRSPVQKKPFFKHPNLKIVKGDILDLEKMKKSARGSTVVIHLAAIAGIDTVARSPVNTMKVNMIGTANVLEAAMKLDNCKRFIQFSTSEVFGPYADKAEESRVTSIGPAGEVRWTYAASKLAGEHLAHAYRREFGLPVISVRPFNVYGPYQVGEGALQVFVKKAIRGGEIQIRGDGRQIRAWCYIDDMVEAILLCLEKEGAIGNVFNIGNPDTAVTIHDLANTVVRVCNSGSSIRFVPKTDVDVELRIPNIEKARRLLGYQPQIGLEEGVRRTAEYYQGELVNQ